MSPINTVGKNSQQILSLIQKQLKTYHMLLNECTKSGRVEAALINHVQVSRFVLLWICNLHVLVHCCTFLTLMYCFVCPVRIVRMFYGCLPQLQCPSAGVLL